MKWQLLGLGLGLGLDGLTVSHILHTISGNFMFRLARTCNDC